MNEMKGKVELSNEDGFSLLELVVAIGIILVLTVGGLIGYSQITDNARKAAVESAASAVMTAALVELSTNDFTVEKVEAVADKWNESASDDSIITDAVVESNSSGYCVKVTSVHKKGVSAERSNCVDESAVDDGSDSGQEIVSVPAASLTDNCVFNGGVMGIGAKISIFYSIPEGYSVDDIKVITSVQQNNDDMKDLEGFSLTDNTTNVSENNYKTDIKTNVLGGLLGLGSSMKVGLVVSNSDGVRSEPILVEANPGMVSGIGGYCNNVG